MAHHTIVILDSHPAAAFVTQRSLESEFGSAVTTHRVASPSAAWERCVASDVHLLIMDPTDYGEACWIMVQLHAADPAAQREYRSYAPLLGMLLEVSAALRITHDIPAVLTLLEEKVPLLFNARTRAMLFAQRELAEQLQELAATQQERLAQVLAPDWPPHSAIALSLRVHETLVGVLVLYNRSTTTPFIASELPFVQALADLAAVAIVDVQQRADLSHARAMHARAQAQLDSAQAQLLQSARLAAVGELAASVAHEINNPLYAARNSLFLAARKIAPDAPAWEYVQLAQDELGRIAAIISRMRDFYRPTREEIALTDLNQVVEETLALVQTHLRHGHVEVQFFPDSHLPPLIVSADQIRQVILNLVLNACDAMALRGGTLTGSTFTIYLPLDGP